MFNFWELEEEVGQFWDRFIGKASRKSYPEEAVYLNDVRKLLAILFRGLGGSVSLNIEASTASEHHARRPLLQKLSGKQNKIELSWQDSRNIYLPYKLDVFPDRKLNQRLYIWLTALNAIDDGLSQPWLQRNMTLTQKVLQQYPGLQGDYQALVDAQLKLRPEIQRLPDDEASQERIIQSALRQPEQTLSLPLAAKPPLPVYLWLHPSPSDETAATARQATGEQAADGKRREDTEKRQRKGQRDDSDATNNKGLLAIRYENIFSWGEFIKLDRSAEEEDDLELAASAAEDMDTLSVTEDGTSIASAIKFDLDLPSAANDDLPVGEGISLDEWHYKKKTYLKNYCRLQEMVSRDCMPQKLPTRLQKTVRRIKTQFEAIMPSRCWFRAQEDGEEIDLDAYMTFSGERVLGHADMNARLYKNLRRHYRDLSCLLLSDLSLSTDAWVNNEARVIDIIKDSLHIFSEALSEGQDRLAIHGFSSRNRNHIRYQKIKSFDETYNDTIRGRIEAIKPGFYTRMGAAIRHASNQLDQEKTTQKLLLLLTDGKPNDLDIYEGRYGVEDTRMAITEARRKGQQVFCVTIDKEADQYLPYLFGEANYLVIHKAADLPARLPVLYARMTQT